MKLEKVRGALKCGPKYRPKCIDKATLTKIAELCRVMPTQQPRSLVSVVTAAAFEEDHSTLKYRMIVLILTAVLVILIWRLLSSPRRVRQLGNLIPGPTAYPIVGNIFNIKLSGTRALQSWDENIKKYGRTYRYWLGPKLFVFISEPDDMQLILSSSTLITKGIGYKTLNDWLGTGLLISTGDLWQKRRKAITPTFHFKVLEDFISTFNKCSKTLVECLKKEVGNGKFPVTEYMSNCALDAIAETAMGTVINGQTNPQNDYPNAVRKMTNSLSQKVYKPALAMEPIYSLSGRRKMEKELLKILFSLPMKIIKMKENERNENKETSMTPKEIFGAKKKTAFLELLLKMKAENAPAFQTDQDIKDEVVTFMFEGHDTTTMALSFTIWLLGLHPEIQEEVFREVSGILGNHEPTMEDYQKMKYLDRVIKESMRLYPPVPAISRTATEDIVLPTSGYMVPTGAQLTLFIYPLHRNPELFPEPEKFNPDRFLGQQKHSFAYIPFSAGPRNCIGQKFAMLELKVVISNILLNYKIESDSEIELDREFLLRASKGLNISITPRN